MLCLLKNSKKKPILDQLITVRGDSVRNMLGDEIQFFVILSLKHPFA